ncbi:uncharacterized protein METZ01_LOCUS434786, partial [marine metagenome]
GSTSLGPENATNGTKRMAIKKRGSFFQFNFSKIKALLSFGLILWC